MVAEKQNYLHAFNWSNESKTICTNLLYGEPKFILSRQSVSNLKKISFFWNWHGSIFSPHLSPTVRPLQLDRLLFVGEAGPILVIPDYCVSTLWKERAPASTLLECKNLKARHRNEKNEGQSTGPINLTSRGQTAWGNHFEVRANVFVCQLSQITLQQVEETPKTTQYMGIHRLWTKSCISWDGWNGMFAIEALVRRILSINCTWLSNVLQDAR